MGKGSTVSSPGSKRIKHRLLEPTFEALCVRAASRAFGTDEHSPPQHNVVYEVRAACQTSGIACP